MASYLEQAKQLIRKFKTCRVKHIKRSENKSADALRKLAATSFEHLAKEVRVDTFAKPSVLPTQVCITQNPEESWTTPVKAYLVEGILPHEKAEDQKIRHKALQYQMKDGIPYRKSFLGPLLRYVDSEDANYLIREIHEGICGLHAGPRMVLEKIKNSDYYWPHMHIYVVKKLRKCESCQRHTPNALRPKNNLILVSFAGSFQKWAIDIMGPFLEAPKRVKFLVVAID
ncbi:uncharacterized protein LOC143538555 [Bidens hawaiensis]|uniref:uncharacterized protein LOC143538555 n=1 Tax=Bidens hawaiensis TaxID=980011 RepID=UPI004048EC47